MLKQLLKKKTGCNSSTVGGQTALNIAMDLNEKGILKKYNIELIGAQVDAINKAEDREQFKASNG